MTDKFATQWIEELFDMYYDELIIRGNSYIHNDSILKNYVEDCVLEAYELAWKKGQVLQVHPSILGWLTKTVYNKLDNVKTSASVRMARTSLDYETEQAHSISDPDAQRQLELWYTNHEHQESLNKILSTLTKSEQEIFDDYFTRQLKIKQIASRRGVSLAAIKATIRRIRKKAYRIKQNKFTLIFPFISILLVLSQIKK